MANNKAQIMYQCAGVAYIYADGSYCIHKDGRPVRKNIDNPIAAWSIFFDLVDQSVRRRIGNMLEKDGRNRYTGASLAPASIESGDKQCKHGSA